MDFTVLKSTGLIGHIDLSVSHGFFMWRYSYTDQLMSKTEYYILHLLNLVNKSK